MAREIRSTERWRIAENVVAAVQRSIGASEGWRVTQNVAVKKRGAETRRQVDVLVEHASGRRIGIDIKAERRPLDIEVVEQLCSKLRKLELDECVIVSASGFTKPALDEAVGAGVLTVSVNELETSTLFKTNFFDRQVADVKDIGIVFQNDTDRPPPELLMHCKIRTEEGMESVMDFAKRLAQQVMQTGQGWKNGELYLFGVTDDRQDWKGLVIGVTEWAAPSAIHISWVYLTERIEGSLFQYNKDEEAFSAIVPANGQNQVTVVTIPNPDGGFQLSVSSGEVRPPRRKM